MPAGSPAVRNVRSPSDRGAREHVLNEIRAIEYAGKSAFPACMCEAAMGRALSDRSPLPPARTDNRPPATGTIWHHRQTTAQEYRISALEHPCHRCAQRLADGRTRNFSNAPITSPLMPCRRTPASEVTSDGQLGLALSCLPPPVPTQPPWRGRSERCGHAA